MSSIRAGRGGGGTSLGGKSICGSHGIRKYAGGGVVELAI